MDYDLAGLSPRSFEQLTQALAAATMGPDLVVFGDGPDGGREATYDGRIPYPSVESSWDGYTVIQAKFRQRPAGTRDDARWLIGELKKELDAYASRARKVPNYLLVATNVVLTPPSRRGSKDRMADFMKEAASELGLRGWDIWDYDKIRVLLDNNIDIRRAYTAWITPGDVLAVIMDHLSVSSPEFESTIVNYLQKELISDVYANLEQAGHAAEDKIPLANVFVDLPLMPSDFWDYSPSSGAVGPGSSNPSEQDCFVSRMIEEASRKCDRDPRHVSKRRGTEREASEGRYVLLGGPGQGKSTLGQFLCQIYRVALLAPRHTELSHEATIALEMVQKRLEADKLPSPQGRRFPLRIPLNSYAVSLATEGGPTSVLGFVVEKINQRVGCNLSQAVFRDWLSLYPWLLIFDGLDEVPSSSNRDTVLNSIADFWVDVATSKSDVFVVATTRPQGYGEEFSPAQYRHVSLRPLLPNEALEYGERLSHTRYGVDRERLDKVVKRLKRATQEDATQRLMQSPLQVTIMTALLDRMGQPPQNRWALFHEYYNVIYLRELEKAGEASDILRDYKPDIDAIHRRVGLLLQVKSERAMQTEARLTQSDLAGIIRSRLQAEGHTDKLDELTTSILTTAAERLVFLVGMENSNRIGFEVRSLQEFMAAECLMDGSDNIVAERLRLVAGIASWRNVVLFAVGRCFGDRQHLRDSVFALCSHLNSDSNDPLVACQRTGSKLAIDMLVDGSARRQPRYQQMIAREALDVLRLPPSPAVITLATVYESSLEHLYRERIREAIGSSDIADALSGWECLFLLDAKEIAWASEMIDFHWPTDVSDIEVMLHSLDMARAGQRSIRHIVDAIPRLPVNFVTANNRLVEAISDRSHATGWIDFFARRQYKNLVAADTTFGGKGFNLQSMSMSVSSERGQLANLGEADKTWRPLIVGDMFSRNPTGAALARALRDIADVCEPSEWRAVRAFVPWPLGACLGRALCGSDLNELAAAVDHGALGDTGAWQAAERRWQRDGISTDDVRHADTHELPFDQRIASVGYPFFSCGWSISHDRVASAVTVWKEIFGEVKSRLLQGVIGGWLVTLASIDTSNDRESERQVYSIDELDSWLVAAAVASESERWVEVGGLYLAQWGSDHGKIAQILDRVGRECKVVGGWANHNTVVDRLVDLAIEFPTYAGLWRILAVAIVEGNGRVPSRLQEAVIDSLSTSVDGPVLYQSIIGLLGPLKDESTEAVVARIVDAIAEDSDKGKLQAAFNLMLPHMSHRPSAAARVLPMLSERLSSKAVSTRRVVADVGEDVLRRRTSPLWDVMRWNDVDLFERDEGIFDEQ